MQEKNNIQFSDSDFPEKQLPQGHREEFLEKLQKGNFQKPKQKNNWWKIVAALVVLVGLGFVLLQNRETNDFPEAETIALELQQIETQYLQEIETEWENFLKIATDKKLIARYKEKLGELDTDYKEISKSYQANKNNLQAVEDLIRNLQTRLTLLQEIQEHIKILNQKTNNHETII